MELIVQDRAWVTVRVPGDPDKAFATICRNNPNARVERWSNGAITIMPPAGNESSSRNTELITQLTLWTLTLFSDCQTLRFSDLMPHGSPTRRFVVFRQRGVKAFSQLRRSLLLNLSPEPIE